MAAPAHCAACDPKKVLVGGAELVDWHRRMTGWGIAGEARIDWPALMRFKRTFTDPVPASREAAFQQAGIATFHGVARFAGVDRSWSVSARATSSSRRRNS